MTTQHSTPTSKPPIRSFQYDGCAIGSLSSSVNLFRGDLNLPQPLFTLPGRSKHSGLDLSVALMYESNVHRDAGMWNRDAPTGVLGLGWSLPLTWIAAQSNGSPAVETRSYAYYDNGSSDTLVQQPQLPLLFTMDGSLASQLQDGAPVPSDVLDQFRSHGLPLSSSATVASVDASRWLVDDESLQQQFTLNSNADVLEACAGGRAYQLQSYDFSQIIYYEKYERWLLVDSSGLRKSFGGKASPTAQGYQVGVNNSIAWSVWWKGAGGLPLWTGPSIVTAGQIQVAEAWYLASVSDRFGDSLQYFYNGWDRNEAGLIPDVEQQVGTGGLPYTKAVYLTGLTDVFGRTVALNYDDKIWSDASDTDPREYADPHRATPSNDPNAYQDRYETKFLSDLAIADASGDTLLSINLVYEPSPGTAWPAVAAVAGLAGALEGDTYKRFLTGVNVTNADGSSPPGMLFEYFMSDDDDGAQRGAMSAITYPQGGRAQLSYANEQLPICDRIQAVGVPAGMASGATPRVFYGSDYVVSTWYSAGTDSLSVQVYTWMGRWICWQLDPNDAIIDTGGVNLDSLGVIADDDFFALYFDGGQNSSRVYLFEKNVGIPGSWQPATLPGGTATGKDSPSLEYPLSGGDMYYQGGAAFLAALQMNSSSGTGSYDLVSWNWSTRAWTRASTTLEQFTWMTAHNEYVFVLSRDGGIVLRYFDGEQTWQQTTGSVTLSTSSYANVQVVPGNAMVAINLLTGANSQQQQYTTILVRWDGDYQMQEPFTASLSDVFGSGNAALPWTPQIIEDSLVATNGNLLRFNGQTWLKNTGLSAQPYSHTTQRFSYGPDFAVRIWASTSAAPSAAVLSFDPDAISSVWSTQPTTPKAALTQTTASWANWPWAGNDQIAVLGPNLYARATATDWQQVFANDPLVVISDFVASSSNFDSESLLNEGPNFLAYAVYDSAGVTEQAVQVLILENGQVSGGAPQSFTTERLFTPTQEGSNGSGTSPQGPQMFVSYDSTSTDFDHAQTIYLHRYAGYAVEGPIDDYPVSKLELFDGFDGSSPTTTICYVYDTSTAACDASGQTVQYFQATVVPGSDDLSQTPYGSQVVQYLNGLGDQSGDNAYDMLNGMLLQTQTFDASGALLATQSNTWTVVLDVASDPTDGTAPTIALRGGWVTQTQQCSTQNGVTSSTQTSFVPAGLAAPYTGQPASTTTTTKNGAGQTETMVSSSSYGVEIDASLRALNVLSAHAGKRSTISVGSDAAVLVRATAITYAPWPSNAGEGVVTPGWEAMFQLIDPSADEFPYGSYEPGDAPQGWQLQGRVASRTPYGQIADRIDACGVHGSTIYSEDFAFAVAKATNAGLGEFAYYGFEPYEDSSTWTLRSVTSETDDVLTGATAGRLAGSAGASMSVTIQPDNRTQHYVLGCWYKSAAGFEASEASGCSVTVTTDGVRGSMSFTGFAASNGEWRQLSVGVPLSAGSSSIELELVVSNGSAADVLIDSVFLLPLIGGLLAKSYEPSLHQVLSLQDAGGRIRRSCYDQLAQPTVSVGLDGTPVELSLSYQSRQGSADGNFDPASPNLTLTLHPAGRSTVESFRDGGAWQQRWRPQTGADWSVSEGELSFGSSGADALRWIGPQPDETWAVYFEVSPQTSSPSLSVSVAGVSIAWSSGRYSSVGAGAALFSPPAMARHWLVVRGHDTVLMFGDGQLLFSAPAQFDDSGLSVVPSTAMGFRHLAVLGRPRVGLNYQDATGRQRQVQQLHGDDCIVGQIVYDAIDRQLAVTRCAPGSFGSGAELPPLQYRPGFIDEAGFISNLADSWVMPGDVSNYYAGQVEDGIARSNDQGYSYAGTRWEASTRQQPLEYGQPGLAQAIANIATTTAEERATTQLIVGPNDGTTIPLPAGAYQQNQIVSPIKTRAMQLLDTRGRSVAYAALDQSGAVVGQSGAVRGYGGGATNLQASMVVQLPNALVAGPQSGDADYVESSTLDGLGRTRMSVDPDAGTTQFIYDACGRLRFVQPQLDDGETGFIYYRYDRAGRMVEEGLLQQAWDVATLESHADDFDWPSEADSPIVAVTWSYDGTGDDPMQIGRKLEAVTVNAAPTLVDGGQTLTSTERFAYDRSGRIVACTLELSGATTTSGTTGYAYDNLGELLVVSLPEGAPIRELRYAYDDLGRITTVGTNSAQLASYTYTAEDKVETETLGDGAWIRAMQYESPGWVEQVQTNSGAGTQSLTLAYTYYADGSFETRSIAFELAASNGTESDSYTYDGQGRLLSATGSSAIDNYGYDPNGNPWSVSYSDGSGDSFPLVSGSDRLQASNCGGVAYDVAYDAQGRLKQALDGSIAYQDATGLSSGWAFGSSQTQLGYGGHRQRVFKRVQQGTSTTDSIYFCGPASGPLARVDGGEWTVYVQGPTGLIALVSASATRYPIKDQLGSVWALVDADGSLVGRYSYLPFGSVQFIAGTSPESLHYLFQGREWDAEAGLYNLGDRMYSPQLRRFLVPDPARQFPSPYVFAANNPLQVSDASGDISTWGQVGIGIAMGAVMVAGVALTVLSAGTAAPAVAAADAAVVGAEAATDAAVATDVAVTAAEGAAVAGEGTEAAADIGATAAEGATEAAGEAGSSASTEVASGATATAESGSAAGSDAAVDTSSAWSSKLRSVGKSVIGSSLTSAGSSGLKYDAQNGQDFSIQGFLEAVGIGALSGLVAGAFGELAKPLAEGAGKRFGKFAGFVAQTALDGVGGAIGNDVTQVITNLSQHQPWYQGLAKQSAVGFTSGAVFSMLSSGAQALTPSTGARTMVQTLRNMATTPAALQVYASSAFYMTNQFVVWGKSQSWGQGTG
jgi:RHS repeat-associated protein